MGEDSEEYIDNNRSVDLEVGFAGIVVFSLILFASVAAFYFSHHRYSKRLFLCSTLVCVLDLPRYIALVIEKSYTSKICYTLHMTSSLFFYLSFTSVCYLLHDGVEIKTSASPMYIQSESNRCWRLIFGRKTLIGSNLIYATLVLVTSIFCLRATSLSSFFDNSIMYLVFTLYDGTVNLMYAFSLSVFGCRLRFKINRFSKTPTGSLSLYEKHILQNMQSAVRRLLFVMVISLLSFTVRVTMLILKIVVIEVDSEQLPSWLPIYGNRFESFFIVQILIHPLL